MNGGRTKSRSIIVGVGNPYMKDDGFGIYVARELKKRDLGDGVLVLERQTLDISLLLLYKETSRLIIIDAIRAGKLPGMLTSFTATEHESPGLNVPLSHDMRLEDLIRLARRNKIRVSPTMVIGVEPADCSIGEGLTEAVKKAVPGAVDAVLKELQRPSRGEG
jgi:hydrogenase maturation protease